MLCIKSGCSPSALFVLEIWIVKFLRWKSAFQRPVLCEGVIVISMCKGLRCSMLDARSGRCCVALVDNGIKQPAGELGGWVLELTRVGTTFLKAAGHCWPGAHTQTDTAHRFQIKDTQKINQYLKHETQL